MTHASVKSHDIVLSFTIDPDKDFTLKEIPEIFLVFNTV